jgi:hypothetical protein
MGTVSISIVSRDVYVNDTGTYLFIYDQLKYTSFGDIFGYLKGDTLFLAISWVVARITGDQTIYLMILWLLFCIPFGYFINKLFPTWKSAIVLFSYMNFVFFYNYADNALRQGIAISFLLVALYMVLNKKKPYIFMIIGSLIHWTCLPFSVVIYSYKFRLRTLLVTWGIFCLLFITNLNAKVVGPLWSLIPNIDTYTSVNSLNSYGNQVNRLDFLILSASVLVTSLFLYYFMHRNEMYMKIIKVYISFNALFLLFGFISFSDRLAVYSWFLIPVLIWFPILNATKYRPVIAFSVLLISFVLGVVTGVYDYYDPFKFFS